MLLCSVLYEVKIDLLNLKDTVFTFATVSNISGSQFMSRGLRKKSAQKSMTVLGISLIRPMSLPTSLQDVQDTCPRQ